MKTAVVVEGPADVIVFKKLLEVAGSEDLTFYSASGFSYADSLARSLLATGTERLALIVDADSQSVEAAADRKRFLEVSLGEMAPKSRFHIVVLVPYIESLLFQDRDLLEKLLNQHVSESDFISGRYEPKPILRRHLGKRSLTDSFAALGQRDLAKLRAVPEIRSLISFVSEPAKAESGRKKTSAVAELRASYRNKT